MLDHATQFDDHWITEQQGKAGKGFVVQKGSKVTTTAHEKPDGLDEKMQAHWDVYVKPVTGHATYADMLADLAA